MGLYQKLKLFQGCFLDSTQLAASNRERIKYLLSRCEDIMSFVKTQCTTGRHPAEVSPAVESRDSATHGAELIVRDTMLESVARKDLKMLHLWRYLVVHEGDDPSQYTLQCQPRECPALGACGKEFPGFSECYERLFNDSRLVVPDAPLNCPFLGDPEKHEHNPRCSHSWDTHWHDIFYAQMFRLRGGVYVAFTGVTFNSAYIVDRHGCYIDQPDLSITKGEGVLLRVKGPVMGLLNFHGVNFYHTMIESIGTFVQAASFLRANPNMLILMHCWQKHFYDKMTKHIIGISLEDMNLVCLEMDEYLFTEDLLQPVFQSCGKPSPSLQQHLRSRYYLPRKGLPIFGKGWVPRNNKALTPEEMALLPSDWVVVLALRPGLERRMEGQEKILLSLQRLFGKDRVQTFTGSPSVLEAKLLFNKAAVFVAAHGAAMTNMLFMPLNSTVLEIRPRDYENACYHHLASACQLQYYLVFGNGTKESTLIPDVNEVLQILEIIAERKALQMRL